jgi:transposase
MTTAEGVPLAVTVTAANQPDVLELLPLVLEHFPKIKGAAGRPPERPRKVIADGGYASRDLAALLAACGIEAVIPQKSQARPPGLGKIRWKVERTIAWLRQFRRLRIRWDRLAQNFEAFVTMACAMIAWRQLCKT